MSKLALGPRILESLFWVTVFILLPLIVIPSTSATSPRALEAEILMPKALMLLIAVLFGMLAIASHLRGLSGRAILRMLIRLPLPIKALALLIPLTISVEVLQSADFAVTALGSSFRLDGAFIQSAWLLVGILAFGITKKSSLPLAVMPILFVLGTLLVGIWAALQVMKVEPLNLFGLGIATLGTPSASLGHRALVTCLVGMGLIVPITWLSLRGRAAFWLLPIVVVLSAALMASEGRAGFVGVAVALSILAVTLILRRPSSLRFLVLAFIAMFIGIAPVLFLKDNGARPLTTIAAATQGNDDSFKARYQYYWPIALKSISEKPLLGWGIEGFSPAFWTFSTTEQQEWIVRSHLGRITYPEVYVTGTPIQFVKRSKLGPVELRYFTVDRAHNWYLDTAVAFGVPYALLLILAIASWTISIFRANSAVALSLGLSAVVFLVFSLVWFATLQLTPLFWVLFGASLGVVMRSASPALHGDHPVLDNTHRYYQEPTAGGY